MSDQNCPCPTSEPMTKIPVSGIELSIASSLLKTCTCRTRLQANLTLYVSTDGDDANDGLANTPQGALKTVQRALDLLLSYDACGYEVIIMVAKGTYSQNVVSPKGIAGLGAGALRIRGESRSETKLTCSSGYVIDGTACPELILENLTVEVPAGANGILTRFSGLVLCNGVSFVGLASSARLAKIYTSGANLWLRGGCSISGSWALLFTINANGYLGLQDAITVSGSCSTFMLVFSGGVCETWNSFSGTMTGQRYSVSTNGNIHTQNNGVNFFPGNVAGTTATGGQYV